MVLGLASTLCTPSFGLTAYDCVTGIPQLRTSGKYVAPATLTCVKFEADGNHYAYTDCASFTVPIRPVFEKISETYVRTNCRYAYITEITVYILEIPESEAAPILKLIDQNEPVSPSSQHYRPERNQQAVLEERWVNIDLPNETDVTPVPAPPTSRKNISASRLNSTSVPSPVKQLPPRSRVVPTETTPRAPTSCHEPVTWLLFIKDNYARRYSPTCMATTNPRRYRHWKVRPPELRSRI